MKKFLLLIAILFTTVFATAQTKTHIDWQLQESGQWGSFFWKVDRTQYKDANGRYWYYVHFYSNSLFNTDNNRDGVLDKAVTYIKSPTVYMYEPNNTVNVQLNHIVCDYFYSSSTYSVYFWSYTPNNNFGITYQSVSPYNYSNY